MRDWWESRKSKGNVPSGTRVWKVKVNWDTMSQVLSAKELRLELMLAAVAPVRHGLVVTTWLTQPT